MPPQKQFFSGGTNGIRAWNPFSLGPGSYKSSENENYFLGDIKLPMVVIWKPNSFMFQEATFSRPEFCGACKVL